MHAASSLQSSIQLQSQHCQQSALSQLQSSRLGTGPATAIPIAWYPLSTYSVVPVMPDDRLLARNAAAFPTSAPVSSSGKWRVHGVELHELVDDADRARGA